MPAALNDLAASSSILAPPASQSTPGTLTLPSRPDVLKTLETKIGTTSTDLETQRKALEEQEKKSIAEHERVLTPAVDKLTKAAEAPMPAAPTYSQEPPIPDISPRAFLGGEGKQALQQIIQGLGLIATSIVGARRAPQAALGALTGAMTGWAEGDAERVSRDWHLYEGMVAKMNRENQKAVKQWEIARAMRGDDLEAAQMTYQAALAKVGLVDFATDIAGKDFMRTGAELTQAQALYTKIEQDYNQQVGRTIEAWRAGETQRHNQVLERFMGVKAKHANDVLKELERSHKAIEEIKRNGPSAQLDKLRLKTAEGVRTITEKNRAVDESLTMLSDLEKAVTILDAKGVIPRGATYADEGKAKLALQVSIGDTDVADAIQTVKRFGTSSVVRKELELMGGKGASIMRLKAIGEAEAGDILMPPKQWWDRFIEGSRRVLTQSKEINAPVLKAYQDTLRNLPVAGTTIAESAPQVLAPSDALDSLGFEEQ